jgi:hypothetical protein
MRSGPNQESSCFAVHTFSVASGCRQSVSYNVLEYLDKRANLGRREVSPAFRLIGLRKLNLTGKKAHKFVRCRFSIAIKENA